MVPGTLPIAYRGKWPCGAPARFYPVAWLCEDHRPESIARAARGKTHSLLIVYSPKKLGFF